jgi:hypothetical protein
MVKEEFEFVSELPPVKPYRNHKIYEDAARSRPGEWLKLPWPASPDGGLVHLYKKYHHLDARTVDGRVYVRAVPEK